MFIPVQTFTNENLLVEVAKPVDVTIDNTERKKAPEVSVHPPYFHKRQKCQNPVEHFDPDFRKELHRTERAEVLKGINWD